MTVFNVPRRFTQQWVSEKVPMMNGPEFSAIFYEAVAAGWDDGELRALARMWADEGALSPGRPWRTRHHKLSHMSS
jgi:hypothetical protein